MPATAATAERLALCDLFDEVGPDAPTLCGDWTTRDLAAHLVVRERRPDGAIGIVAPPLASYGEKVRRGEAARPWPELVEQVRSGPPWWSPTRIDAVDRLFNTIEFFVHHEDVRRTGDNWTARDLGDELRTDLVSALSRGAPLLVRSAPVGITLRIDDDSGESDVIVARDGSPAVTISGSIGEVTLYLYGRRDQSNVELDGTDEALSKLAESTLGI